MERSPRVPEGMGVYSSLPAWDVKSQAWGQLCHIGPAQAHNQEVFTKEKEDSSTVGMPGVDARGHLGMSDAGEGSSHSICYSTWMKGNPGLKPSLEYLGFKPFLPLF